MENKNRSIFFWAETSKKHRSKNRKENEENNFKKNSNKYLYLLMNPKK
jgi:hypothetical protein